MISLKLWLPWIEIEHFDDDAFVGDNPNLEHSYDLPGDSVYRARCSTEVAGDRATLRYTALLNEDLDVGPGTMEIFFAAATRQEVTGVTWQPSGLGQWPRDVPFIQIEYSEGGRRFAVHQSIERNTGAVRQRKAAAGHNPVCEICEMIFAVHYKHGDDFIECHHLRPLAEIGPRVTRQDELILVCSNCHRMIHRHIRLHPDDPNNWTLDGLQQALAYQP